MEHIAVVLVSLLVAVVVLSALATRIGIPYPILLVAGGLVLRFVPVVPDIRLRAVARVITLLATARRLGVPRRTINVLEGESLVNDASALVLYKIAVGTFAGAAFSIWAAGLDFLSPRAAAWRSASSSRG